MFPATSGAPTVNFSFHLFWPSRPAESIDASADRRARPGRRSSDLTRCRRRCLVLVEPDLAVAGPTCHVLVEPTGLLTNRNCHFVSFHTPY